MEWIGKLLSVHTGDTWYVGKEFFDMNEKEQKEIKAEEERIRENGQATLEENGKRIHLLSIIGEIEGHENLSGSTKTTKYEHILPELAKVESDETIGGVLILVNTIGGDVSCGLALAEMIASGVTTISNAAREPEIVDLQAFLQKLGASIHGAGTSTVVVEGAEQPLHGCRHRILGDRIAAATYLAAAAAAGGDVFLRDIDYRHLSTVTGVLRQAGCTLSCQEDGIRLVSDGCLRAVSPIRTAPYPGFPTDAQAVVMSALLRSSGTTVFVENIFESRYHHVPELVRMGADIRLEGRVAVVCGVDRLQAARVRAMDLRGGAALVIAGLQAHGVTTVEHLHHIRRGYSDLPGDLALLGAHIHTENTEGGASDDPTPQTQTQPPETAGQLCVSL